MDSRGRAEESVRDSISERMKMKPGAPGPDLRFMDIVEEDVVRGERHMEACDWLLCVASPSLPGFHHVPRLQPF